MTKARITEGEWIAHYDEDCDEWGVRLPGSSGPVYRPIADNILGGRDCREANARLIALAGTTANRLYDLGYDPVVVLERLPRILDLFGQMSRDVERMLDSSKNCGDPDCECPMQDAFDIGGTADIATQVDALLTTLTKGGE